MFTVKFHFYQDCPKCKNYHHLSLQPTVRWENPPIPVVEVARIWSRNVIQGFICLKFCHVFSDRLTIHIEFQHTHNMSRKILNCSDRHIPWTLLFGGFVKWWYPTTTGFSIKKRIILGWRLGVPPFEGFPLLNLVQRNWRVLLGNSIRSHLHTT